MTGLSVSKNTQNILHLRIEREREKKRKPPPSFNLALFRKAHRYFIFSFLLKNDQVGETPLAAALKEGRNSTN